MRLPTHDANAGVLRHLGQGLAPEGVSIEPVPPDIDTRRLGAHPDVVDHLWAVLATALPGDARRLVAGGAVLVDPRSGLVLAVALGTQYAIRLTGEALAEARSVGHESVHTFRTSGGTLDLEASFGDGWLFGRRDRREPGWLAASRP